MYPRQVLALSPGGAQVVGMETDFVTLPSPIDVSRPVAVDTVTGEIYYFSGDLLLNSSIQAGGLDTLLFKVDILAMTFDWVARALYYAVRNDAEGSLELYRVPVLAKKSNTRVFPALAHPLSSCASLQLAVDPTRGFLYWLESNGSLVQLHSLDFRLDNSPASTVLSTTGSRRKRGSNSLASLNLSPVLSMDSVTGALLVASTSGDVHSCNVGTGQCEVVVDASALSATPSRIGLPPTSIAVDERHIYWTSPAVAGVYAVERTNTSALITVSSVNASALLGLSPGSQPLGSIECLSPDFSIAGERPLPRVTNVSSTTISLGWDEPTLPESCDSVTFSFPPLTYVPHVSLNPRAAGEPAGFTHETQFTVENLKPFFEYQIQMATFNVFTPRRIIFDTLLSIDVYVVTTEGVPDPPMGLNFVVLGTATVQLIWMQGEPRADPDNVTYYIFTPRWNRFDTLLSIDVYVVTTEGVPDPPMGLNFVVLGTATVQLIWMQGELRADPDDVTYYIFTGAGHVTETMGSCTNVTINSTNGIVPGSTQTIQVLTSNKVFNSTAANVTVPFWPLAPPPEMIMSTNSSFSTTIVLTVPLHEDIRGVTLQHCLPTNTAVANMACSCPGSDNRTELQAGVAPSSFEFSVENLTTYTLYCLQLVAVYRMVGRSPAEVTAGLGVVMRTSEGRPDAPLSVTLSGTLLTWSPPPPRSEGGITRYSISAYEVDNGLLNDTAEVAGSTLMVDLQTHTELDLVVGVFYDVHVRAVNSEGIGPPSDSVEFRREARAVLGPEAIIPIAVSGTVLIALCLCFILFCGHLVCCYGRS